jgi:hypothetical protein
VFRNAFRWRPEGVAGIDATRMTQIGQNEPLAPAAAQIPTHTSTVIAAAPAR